MKVNFQTKHAPPSLGIKEQYATTLNLKVILRILTALHESGNVKRTNLARKTGLNYNKCVRYLNLLQLLGWIKVVTKEGFFVAITERGTEIVKRIKIFS